MYNGICRSPLSVRYKKSKNIQKYSFICFRAMPNALYAITKSRRRICLQTLADLAEKLGGDAQI
jgi:hypothetical protein